MIMNLNRDDARIDSSRSISARSSVRDAANHLEVVLDFLSSGSKLIF